MNKSIYLHDVSLLSAVVTTPSGRKQYPKIEDNKNGTVTVRYQPTETGLHTLDMAYNNAPISGSPFQFHVDNIHSGHVTAYGPGLSHGIAGQPATFTIVTKDAGAGILLHTNRFIFHFMLLIFYCYCHSHLFPT